MKKINLIILSTFIIGGMLLNFENRGYFVLCPGEC